MTQTSSNSAGNLKNCLEGEEREGPPTPESAFSPAEVEERHTAYVRYGFPDGDRFEQQKLCSVSRRIPTDAVTVSTGVYFLTDDQEFRLHDGLWSKIIQDECEEDGRVAHTIVAESDALERSVTVSEVVGWLTTFIEEWVGVENYSLYYSGNRSIHIHTDSYVTGDGLKDLKRLAERFNAEYDADLDTSIYKPKQQFRLIGAKHHKTGLHKVEVPPDADRAECIKRAQNAPERMDTHHELPTPSHANEMRHLEAQSYSNILTREHYRPGIESIAPLPQEFRGQVVWGVYKGGNSGSVQMRSNESEYASPFSPYRKTGGANGRSVIVMEQLDGLRCNRYDDDSVFVPAQIHRAIGGGDGSYTRENSKTLVRLSPRDYDKWSYSPGDTVVIIGGNSGSSRIFAVDEVTSTLVSTALKAEGRERALEVLSNRGHDVGSAGYHANRFDGDGGSDGETEAIRIKRGIENGTRERDYDNVLRVVCHLLRVEGWDAAWGWCEDIFRGGFDAKQTHQNLKAIVEAYDDYSHVKVPESVEEAQR